MIVALLMSTVFLVLMVHGRAYDLSFQGMVNRKYDCLQKEGSPKIVYVSGSSGLFGVDTDYLESLTGKKIVNLALHAGFGTGFITNMAVRNLQKGDVLVLAYEYTRWNTGPEGDVALIVSGIDQNMRLYQYVTNGNYKKIIEYLPAHCMKKLDIVSGNRAKPDESGSFDEKGNLAVWKKECTLPEDISEYSFGLSAGTIKPEMAAYAKTVKQQAAKRGAEVVFAAPPVLGEATDISAIGKFCGELTKQTGIQWISDPREHVFQRKEMGDTIWHCNYYGKNRNTEQLAKDLMQYFEK